ncbi:MAG TPA: 50S ribosomal protein L24 [Candidatus Doudnabacteria bacterium]|nr:50S ribosomal protein L24 [Candidatus Doudnabacteria bacterium]
MTQVKLKIKKGDTVKVLSGKDKGKTGKVLRVFPLDRKVIVENANIHTKYERPRGTRQRVGQKVTFASPMAVSKVMLIDPSSGKPSRIGYQMLENGTKQRIAKKSGKAV